MEGFRPPFSIDAFLEVFARYNTAIWPLQVVAYVLGILVVIAAMRPFRGSDRLISGVLSLLWIWVGAVYHLIYFRAINRAALLFGILFILQGVLFFVWGVICRRLRFHAQRNSYGVVASIFILYAMAIYPALGYVFGHMYPHAPMFGVAPCPLLIFTFGLLLLTTQRLPGYLFIIPGLWAILGISAAISLGIRQDWGLVVSAVVTIVMFMVKYRQQQQAVVRATEAVSER